MTELDESPAGTADYDITPLLQPLQVRGLRLRNRFVMPGMQRYWCVDGAPDHRLREYYLWPGTNQRTDRYGGPAITDRATFVTEVTQAVREATGPDFVISVRISQWKESDYNARIVEEPGQLGQLVAVLRAAGADIFHMSTRRFWTPEWAGSDLGLAGWAKSFTDAAVIAVGSVGLDIDVMASLDGQEARPTGASRIGELVCRFQRGDFDLVSVGRSQIGDPDWITKMTHHRIGDIRAFRAGDPSLGGDVVAT